MDGCCYPSGSDLSWLVALLLPLVVGPWLASNSHTFQTSLCLCNFNSLHLSYGVNRGTYRGWPILWFFWPWGLTYIAGLTITSGWSAECEIDMGSSIWSTTFFITIKISITRWNVIHMGSSGFKCFVTSILLELARLPRLMVLHNFI